MVVDFVWGFEAEAEARAVIKFFGNDIALLLGERLKRGAFWKILADEAVSIFVGAAFPSMVRGSEVEVGTELLFYIFIAMELSSIIRGDSVDVRAMRAEEFDGALLGVQDGGLRQRSNADEARFTLDDGEERGLIGTVHGVDFPVVEPGALLDDGGPFRDHFFARESAPAIGLAVAFAFDFSRAA